MWRQLPLSPRLDDRAGNGSRRVDLPLARSPDHQGRELGQNPRRHPIPEHLPAPPPASLPPHGPRPLRPPPPIDPSRVGGGVGPTYLHKRGHGIIKLTGLSFGRNCFAIRDRSPSGPVCGGPISAVVRSLQCSVSADAALSEKSPYLGSACQRRGRSHLFTQKGPLNHKIDAGCFFRRSLFIRLGSTTW